MSDTWEDSWTCGGCTSPVPDKYSACPVCKTEKPAPKRAGAESDSQGSPFTPQQIHEMSAGGYLYETMLKGAEKHRGAGARVNTRDEAKALAASMLVKLRRTQADDSRKRDIEEQAELARRWEWWRQDCESAQRNGLGMGMDPENPPWLAAEREREKARQRGRL